MKQSTLLWLLAAANVLLAAALCQKLGTPVTAQAQRAAIGGDYIMLPGKASNWPAGIMYMIDTRNGLLSGFIFDHNRSDFSTMPPIDLNRVFNMAAAPAPVAPGRRQP
jgi:hypothetical protein